MDSLTRSRLFRALKTGWEWLKDLASILKPCRFSLIMLLIGVLFLVLAPQGQDIVRALTEHRGAAAPVTAPRMWFFASMLLWALHIWYWARVMLRFRFEAPPARRERRLAAMRREVPRLLGVAAFLTVAAAFYRAALPCQPQHGCDPAVSWMFALFCVAFAAVFYFAVAARRPVQRQIHDKLRGRKAVRALGLAPWVARLKVSEDKVYYAATRTRLGQLEPGSRLSLALSLTLAVGLFALFTLSPLSAATFGGGAIVLLAAACWVPIGGALVYFGSRYKFPIMTLLLAGALLFSLWNDNHALRTLPGEPPAAPENVARQFEHWLKAHPAPAGRRQPVFVVAAEGGGIRAAYWTGLVLAALQDRDTRFADQVFAVSGVSGGSLGAAMFDALLLENPDAQRCPGDEISRARGPFVRCAHAMLSADFMAPALAFTLYPDLAQRFLPFAVPAFDRARALETAWEVGWSKPMGNDRFSAPFHELWRAPGGERLPALLLNGTWVETGKRIVTSNLRIDQSFADTVDYFEKAPHPIRLSTAVHNSARFTYVSPAGTIRNPDGSDWGHVVDGGYFENSGATSAHEALQAMLEVARKAKRPLVPVAIMISNDPGQDDGRAPPARQWLNELLSPAVTLLNTRNARGSYARSALCRLAEDAGGRFVHFRLRDGGAPLPLGWMLSELAMQTMWEQFDKLPEAMKQPRDWRRLERTDCGALIP